MPWPSSMTRIMRLPPDSTSTRMVFAPASRAFSSNSLTTEAGRSTTSPAAILLATDSGRMRMRVMRCGLSNEEPACDELEAGHCPGLPALWEAGASAPVWKAPKWGHEHLKKILKSVPASRPDQIYLRPRNMASHESSEPVLRGLDSSQCLRPLRADRVRRGSSGRRSLSAKFALLIAGIMDSMRASALSRGWLSGPQSGLDKPLHSRAVIPAYHSAAFFFCTMEMPSSS